jgi:hypothetical protein
MTWAVVVGDQQAAPSSVVRHEYRDAHAASAESTLDGRLAVARSDGIMLVGGVSARARRVRRRLAARCCRHEVAFPQSPVQPRLFTPESTVPWPHAK